MSAKESVIGEKRKEALAAYDQLPMPREREEAWRYTPIDRFDIRKFMPFSAPSITLSPLPEHARKKGAIFCPMAAAINEHYPLVSNYHLKNTLLADKFLALNAAVWQDGVFLYIPKNVHLEEPLSAMISGKTNCAAHTLIILEEGSSASYMEEHSYLSEQEIMATCVTEVFAGSSAKLRFNHLTRASEQANIFNSTVGEAKKDAEIQWAWATFGGKLNRLRVDTLFAGEGARSENIGIMIGKGKQHLDCTTNAYHNAPNTTNDMAVKAIMMDSSRSIYRGLIKIRKEAQGTNSYLSNHVLKLSDKSLANSIPALEIDANEVKASHGATMGQVDEEQLFYLRSRGLSQQEAEKLIVEGFFEPLILKLHPEAIQQRFRSAVQEAISP